MEVTLSQEERSIYLGDQGYMDHNHEAIQHFVERHTDPEADALENIKQLYLAVRDGFRYDPSHVDMQQEHMKASSFVKRKSGYCVEKANLLGACARAIGMPARLGFAIVKNHIGTEKIEQILRTDKLVFHGYTQMYLNGKWVTATPAFNKGLCDKLGVDPLEFDAIHDSIFQEYDRKGGSYMKYLHDYGVFAEIPRELMISEFKKHYPHLFDEGFITGNEMRFIV